MRLSKINWFTNKILYKKNDKIYFFCFIIILTQSPQCEVYETYDTDTQKCEKVCKNNEYFNEDTFTCKICNEGEIYNPKSKQCEKQENSQESETELKEEEQEESQVEEQDDDDDDDQNETEQENNNPGNHQNQEINQNQKINLKINQKIQKINQKMNQKIIRK